VNLYKQIKMNLCVYVCENNTESQQDFAQDSICVWTRLRARLYPSYCVWTRLCLYL